MDRKTHFVYKQYDEQNQLLYVGCTSAPRVRMALHRNNSPWFSKIDRVEIKAFTSKLEAVSEETRSIVKDQPKFNIAKKTRGYALKEKFQKLRDQGLTLQAIGELEYPKVSRQYVHQVLTDDMYCLVDDRSAGDYEKINMADINTDYKKRLQDSEKLKIRVRRLAKLKMKHILIAKREGITPARVSQIVRAK